MKLRRVTVEELESRRRGAVDPEALAVVSPIVEDVRRRREPGVLEAARRLGDLGAGDRVYWRRDDLCAALEGLAPEERARLQRIAGRIRRFAEAQRGAVHDVTVSVPGGAAGHRLVPVERAGCYVPGGRYPLPSTALMTVVTARVAGVQSVWVASPRPRPITLAAAALAGADGLLAVGGAQAIAALAFGCGLVPPSDIVVGPGNAYVTAAKYLVSGDVAIDLLAGPSEVVILADETSEPGLVAADLVAQAEHDPAALPVLVVTDPGVIPAVERELGRQLADLPTAQVACLALERGGAVVAASDDEAVRLCDRLAPEHVEVLTRNPESVAARLTRFGTVFAGSGAGEILGDYGAGPNHVLPTGGSARVAAGLSVLTFLRARTWLRVPAWPDRELTADAAWLARCEGLEAHARAAERRVLRCEVGGRQEPLLAG